MTTAAFTEAAMTHLAAVDHDKNQDWFNGFVDAIAWARTHLATQTPTDAEVEAAAKAMFDVVSGGLDWNGEHNDETTRERFRNMARAALTAARQDH